MKVIKIFFIKLITLLKRNYKFHVYNEFPEYCKKYEINLIGENDQFDFLSMTCPCGCKEQLKLSLVKKDKPHWEVIINNKKISISPSIWKNKGCKSHFFIRNSKVIWAKEQYTL